MRILRYILRDGEGSKEVRRGKGKVLQSRKFCFTCIVGGCMIFDSIFLSNRVCQKVR